MRYSFSFFDEIIERRGTSSVKYDNFRKVKVGLSRGREFGVEGEAFVRMSLACPASTIRQAIRQIDNIFRK